MNLKPFAVGLLATLCCVARAQQPSLVKVEPDAARAAINQTVSVKITVGSPGDKIWCGAVVTFGDGESRELRIDQSPYTITKVYKSTGSYTISVVGKFIGRFLKSASGCTGSIASEHILVEDPAAQATQAEAQRASQAEIDKLKADLARAQQQLRQTPPPAQPNAAAPAAQEQYVAPPKPSAPKKPRPPASSASDTRPF